MQELGFIIVHFLCVKCIFFCSNCPINCNATAVIARLNLRHWKDQEQRRQLPINRETLEKAIRLGAEQFRRAQEAETGRLNRQPRPTIEQQQLGGQISSALLAHASLMAPKRESLDIARTAGILREATKVLLRGSVIQMKGNKKY